MVNENTYYVNFNSSNIHYPFKDNYYTAEAKGKTFNSILSNRMLTELKGGLRNRKK